MDNQSASLYTFINAHKDQHEVEQPSTRTRQQTNLPEHEITEPNFSRCSNQQIHRSRMRCVQTLFQKRLSYVTVKQKTQAPKSSCWTHEAATKANTADRRISYRLHTIIFQNSSWETETRLTFQQLSGFLSCHKETFYLTHKIKQMNSKHF